MKRELRSLEAYLMYIFNIRFDLNKRWIAIKGIKTKKKNEENINNIECLL